MTKEDLLHFLGAKDFNELEEYIKNNPNNENAKFLRELIDSLENKVKIN